MHKTAFFGIGGLVAMATLERLNMLLGTLVGLLTVTHLCIQIIKTLKKK